MQFIKAMKTFIYSERTINSVKTAIACLVGFLIIIWFNLPFGQWTIITILVVMSSQISFGAAIKTSYIRLVGTIAGTLISALTLLLFDDNFLAIILVILISTIIFTYIASSSQEISSAGALGAVTVAAILINTNPSLKLAGLRFLEITLGIGIALVISKLLFPIHARSNLRHNQASTLKNVKVLYENTIASLQNIENPYDYYELDEEIISTFADQKKLISESSIEIFSGRFERHIFERIVLFERTLFRTINFMYLALNAEPQNAKLIYKTAEFQRLNRDILHTLDQFAQYLDEDNMASISPPTTIVTKNLCDELSDAIHSLLIHEKHTKLVSIHSFLFGAEHLVHTLIELGNLIQELSTVRNVK